MLTRVLSLVSAIISFTMLSLAPARATSLSDRILQHPLSEIDAAVEIVSRQIKAWRSDQIFLSGCYLLPDPIKPGQSKREELLDQFFQHFKAIAEVEATDRANLELNGYPESIWGPRIKELTAARIAGLKKGYTEGIYLGDVNSIRGIVQPTIPSLEKALVEALNKYRLEHGASFPPVAPIWEQCGGEGLAFMTVDTVPRASSLYLIKDFYYALCEIKGYDPLSRSDCDQWVSSTGQPFGLGTYRYMANWADGHTECDRIELVASDLAPGDTGQMSVRRSGQPCR